MEDFPTDEFDVIICGTGLKECIISGLLSKEGKKILQIDRNDFYGGESASLNMLKMCEKFGEEKYDDSVGKSRDYAIDLCPKLIIGSGEMVSMLIHTGVTRYLDFKATDGSFCYMAAGGGKLHEVPVTAKAALASSLISSWQKLRAPLFFRWLANFKVEDQKTWNGYKPGITMEELYTSWKLDDTVKMFCGHCLALYTDDGYLKDSKETLPCLNRMQMYAESLLRFGNSPYIYPQYGLGGLPEGFSRLSAVYGGTFMLRCGVESFVYNDKGRVTGVKTTTGNTAKLAATGVVISDPSYFEDTLAGTPKIKKAGRVARWYCIMKKCPEAIGEAKGSAQIILPGTELKRPSDVYISVTSFKLGTAPKDVWIATISSNVFTENPKAELQQAYQILGGKDCIVKEFFSVSDRYAPINKPGDDGCFITESMDPESHFQSATLEVKRLYEMITGKKVDLSKKVEEKEAE